MIVELLFEFEHIQYTHQRILRPLWLLNYDMIIHTLLI